MDTIAHIKIGKDNYFDKTIEFIDLPTEKSSDLKFKVKRNGNDNIVDTADSSSKHIIINIKQNNEVPLKFKQLVGTIATMNMIDSDKHDWIKIILTRHQLN